MNQLYPIIRRKRRPLIEPEEPVVVIEVKPRDAQSQSAAAAPVPVAVPTELKAADPTVVRKPKATDAKNKSGAKPA